MGGEIAGEAKVDGVPKGQHAALTQEHVVGEGEDDQHPHLAQDDEGEAGRLVQDPEQDEHRRDRDPNP